MRPISEDKVEVFEDLALESVKQIRAYFKYEGNDQRYLQKAKVGATSISAYARLRASETNRMAVELAAGKLIEPTKQKAIGK